MKILGTGLSGLVGSRVVELLSGQFSFEDLSLDTGVDVTDKNIVDERIRQSDAPWVFHFAAKTDVDRAEKERALGEESPTWILNVGATKHIVDSCKFFGKKLLYISTDYVFDGTKDFYTEDDSPNPQGWYAVTKYEGEKLISQLGENGLVIRIANPYKAVNKDKLDFVHKIISLLKNGTDIESPSDQIFIPTLIDDIAGAIRFLVEKNAKGIFHVAGSQALSPFNATKKIAVAFGLDPALVSETTFAKYFSGRAPRPFRADLKNDKLSKFGFRMSTFDEGLKRVISQHF